MREKSNVPLILIPFLPIGFVIGFKGLLGVRFFLGVVEGPVAPAIFLYLSGFYTRSELGLRYVPKDFVLVLF